MSVVSEDSISSSSQRRCCSAYVASLAICEHFSSGLLHALQDRRDDFVDGGLGLFDRLPTSRHRVDAARDCLGPVAEELAIGPVEGADHFDHQLATDQPTLGFFVF